MYNVKHNHCLLMEKTKESIISLPSEKFPYSNAQVIPRGKF